MRNQEELAAVLARAFTVTVVAIATLLIGSLASVRVDTGVTGVARGHACSLDVAVVGDVNDAEGDEEESHSCFSASGSPGAVDGVRPATGGGRFVVRRRENHAERHCLAAAVIRGPPLRG